MKQLKPGEKITFLFTSFQSPSDTLMTSLPNVAKSSYPCESRWAVPSTAKVEVCFFVVCKSQLITNSKLQEQQRTSQRLCLSTRRMRRSSGDAWFNTKSACAMKFIASRQKLVFSLSSRESVEHYRGHDCKYGREVCNQQKVLNVESSHRQKREVVTAVVMIVSAVVKIAGAFGFTFCVPHTLGLSMRWWRI